MTTPGCFPRFLRRWYFRQDWVVYAKPPFGGASMFLNYPPARYTHRVAISNHRLVTFENGSVSFRWRGTPCARRQEEGHDCFRPTRVPAPLPTSCSASRTGSHPPLRTLRKPQAKCCARTLPRSARRNGMRRSNRAFQPALSSMLRHHARCRTAHPRPALLPSEPDPAPAREVQR